MEPTPKYLDEQNRIAQEAFTLFVEKGFNDTSISDIAKAAGIQKALVQYYFPKKENFAHLFIEQTMQYVLESINNTDIKFKNDIERFYLIGYFEAYYLFKHDSMKNLRMDILESREYSKTITNTIYNFTLENTKLPMPKSLKTKLYRAYAFAIGGMFEYVYSELSKGEDLRIDKLVDSIIDFISAYLGFGKPTKVELKLTDEWLEEKAKEIDKLMLK